MEDLLTNAKQSLMAAVQSLFLCNYPMDSAPFLMQLKTLASVRETLFAVESDEVFSPLLNYYVILLSVLLMYPPHNATKISLIISQVAIPYRRR